MSGISLNYDGQIAVLTLDNPERHNALGKIAIEAAVDAIREAQKRARVLLVTGAGEQTFCAGALLSDMQSGSLNPDSFERVTNALYACPIPTIAALNGNAFGGGVELALCCDFRLAREGIKLQVPASSIGICYPANGIKRLVAILGLDSAKHLLLRGQAIEGDALLYSGAIERVLPSEELIPVAWQRAQQLAQLAPLAMKGMKELLNRAAVDEWDDARYRDISQRCLLSEDLIEGLAAKKEKRQAHFKGK
jgi:enoyl-CoA hydratase/carnithine racemase